jgi:small nuclear ribonucleoprotein (snRNP)-like protein
MATKKKIERHVLVTTAHRGVFFGTLASEESHAEVVLTAARNVISWSGRRGFLGLASHGPERESRIGSTAERIRLYDVTSITDCTAAAVACFRGWPEP